MKTIDRQEVQRKLYGEPNFVLIEVLSEEEFATGHLPGAVNVPLGDDDFAGLIAEVVPDKSLPVIVYCQNEECDASPRAAGRLEELGYQEVYDYGAGKDDWEAAGNRL